MEVYAQVAVEQSKKKKKFKYIKFIFQLNFSSRVVYVVVWYL